jgi:simple sugar transport system ATP-binding protein
VHELLLVKDGRALLDRVSFDVRPGEIVGLTGVRQNGIEAMEEVLGGITRPSGGSVKLAEESLLNLTPRMLRRRGIGYVPTDRLLRGASLHSSVAENLIVLERNQLQRAGIFLPDRIAEYGRRLTGDFGIDGVLQSPLRHLSGGNIQKVILSRELAGDPRLLVVCEPGWGLDIRSRELIFGRIRDAAESGAAVVVISTDADEVLDLADRVGVLFAGRLTGPFPSATLSRESVGRLMAGTPEHAPKTGGSR